jgi:hypothetical protein
MNKKIVLTAVISIIATVIITVPVTKTVFAEQNGSSPESGVVSRIKSIYDSLVSLSYGSESAGSWGDWGSMWNRIRSAGEWTPDGDSTASDVITGKTLYSDSRTQLTGTFSLTGDATVSDVASGKTFYNNSTTLLTGTANLGIDYSLQQYVKYDDKKSGDYTGEESTWTQISSSPQVWKDERTGLYWSGNQGSKYHNFWIPDCDFFSTNPRGNYNGADPDCGDAINFCATFDSAGRTDWYLPTQKELWQAMIDGMYNKAGSTFTTSDWFWSSTEVANCPSCAWVVSYSYDYPPFASKSDNRRVRCVARD